MPRSQTTNIRRNEVCSVPLRLSARPEVSEYRWSNRIEAVQRTSDQLQKGNYLKDRNENAEYKGKPAAKRTEWCMIRQFALSINSLSSYALESGKHM